LDLSYTGVLLARFFLGFAEAPFYPGVLFLISGWYKRDELALRAALVSCGIPISSGFGALIASGILQGMQGKLGQAAWRREHNRLSLLTEAKRSIDGCFTSRAA
jgi:MFS family permease